MKGFSFTLVKKALLAVIIILLPIVVAFSYSYIKNRELFKRHALEDLSVIGETFEADVYNILDLSEKTVKDFASDGFITDALRRIGRGDRFAAKDLNAHLVRNKLPIGLHISLIHAVGLDGKVKASTDPSAIGADLSKEPFFSGVDVTTSETLIDERPALAISAPVKGSDTASRAGFLVAFIKLSDLSRVMSGEFKRGIEDHGWRSSKKSLEAYIVNRDTLMLTESRFIQGSVLKTKVATEPVLSCINKGADMNGFYKDYRGISVAGASKCIKPLGWTLLVEIDTEEALAPVSAMKRHAVMVWALVAGLIALLFIIFYKSIVLQLRKIFGAAKSISAGNYDVRVPVASSDEIGAVSVAFNEMASDIKTALFALSESEERLKEAQHISRTGSWIWDVATGRVIWSDELFHLFGVDPASFNGTYQEFVNLIHEEDRGKVNESVGRALRNEAPYSLDYRIRRPDGQVIYIHSEGKVKFDHAGEPVRMLRTVQDITGRKNVEEALRESEALLKRAQEIAHLGHWQWDILNNTLKWSDEIYRIFGLKPQEFGATYEAFLRAVHPADKEYVEHAVWAALYEKNPYSIDHRIILPDGAERHVHEEADVSFDIFGKPVRMIGTVQDITERKKTEFELKKLSMAMEQSVNIVFITDMKGTIEYVNPMFELVTGYSKEEAVGQNPRILSSGEVVNQDYENLWKTILAGKTWRNVYKNKKKSGSFYWSNSVISPIKNEKGEITHFLAVQEDITEKMVSEEKIQYLARYDELTGLVNRTRFIELLDDWIYVASTSGEIGAFCLLDMDDFKFLNDTYGHGAGDEFLRRASRVIASGVERERTDKKLKEPIIGRLSGDEFAVFIPGVAAREALSIAETLRKGMEDFRFQEAPIAITVSIGIVLFPAHGRDAKELFTRADAAMYRAKELGRNRFHLYIPEDQDLEKMHSRVAWKERILKSLREDRFEPWFQPILDLSTNSVHHYESLARLKAEDGSIMLPGAFIDIAERFGLVGSIDRMIIEKSMRMQSRLRKEGRHISFGMNLSGKDLGDDDLLSFLKTKMIETGADPDKLVFEITETAAIGDLDRAIKFIKALKEIGCHFALDDFGVGFTSFTYLREMQVDYIKIDGSFIRKLNVSPNDQVFVKALTDVAKGLKIKSIAEFVENKETLDLLKTFGVDFAQGYLVGKPAPPEAAFPIETLTQTPGSRV